MKFRLIVLLFLLGLLVVAATADTTKEMEQQTDPSISDAYAPEEILIQFSGPMTEEKIAKKVEKFYGTEIKKEHKIAFDYSEIGLPNTYLVKLSKGEDPKEVKERYKQEPDVVYAELNYIARCTVLPGDTSFSKLWGLHNTGQTGGIPDADIDAPEAWDLCTGSDEVIIAVIDTGVDYNHPDLAGNIWTNPGEIAGNGIDDDNNGYIDDIHGWDFFNEDNNPLDDNGHGTHCAGTIGAIGNNGQGVAGVTWHAKIMPLKYANADGSGLYSDATAAILYANKMGARVMSNSWGGTSYSYTLESAINSSDALVVCAAGNSASNIDTNPFYPASYSSPQVLTVASSTKNDTISSFSNYGVISVDVAAPGESIYSTLPNGSYGYKTGTSMATPHVAGLAGLLYAYHQGITYTEAKSAILASVDEKISLSGKVGTGGRINAYQSLLALDQTSLSVTGITPEAALNSSVVSLTILGTGFTSTPSVKLAGQEEILATEVNCVSSSELNAHIELTGKTAGRYDLVVTNPDSAQATLTDCFEIIAPNPPVVTGISPSSVLAGGSECDLHVTGTDFTPASRIMWNGAECSNPTTYHNATQLSTIIPADCIKEPGTVLITVSDPVTGTSGSLQLAIEGIASPAITKISPSSGKRGSTRSYTITGTNFVTGASAELRQSGSIIPCMNELIQSGGTTMTCTITIPSNASRGYWDVAVVNPDGQTVLKSGAFRIN